MSAIAAFEAYCEAFARADAVAMADLFTEDGIFEASSLDNPIQGRRELERQLRIIASAQRDIATEIKVAIEQGDLATIEGAYHAQAIGAGTKVDGAPLRVDFKFVATVEMRGGKIARLAEIFDTRPLHPEERMKVWTMNRRTPYWDGTVEAQAMEWSVYNNMYFPMVYSRLPYEDYAALVEGVTLWDVGLERQTEIRGPDALAFLDYLSCRDMSAMKTGDCRYDILCDDKGFLMSDPVVLRPWDEVIWISHGSTDITLWARGLALNGDWRVEIREPDVAPLQLQGPLSLEVLRGLCDAPVGDMRNYSCLVTRIAGQEAVVSRTGWSGGFGFEIFPLSSARALELWQAIRTAGAPYDLKVTGPNVSRAMERGVTDMGYYSNSDMNPFEDLSAKLVDLDTKADFVGKEALRKIKAEGVKRHSVGLFIEGEVPRLEWFWDLTDDEGRKGEVRWAAHSFGLGRAIGIAVVDKAIQVGAAVTIAHPYGRSKAEVTTVPFVGRGA